ncbi:hypothetical protein FHETE_1280 [Fusarium heterosporum]|uniref:Uncharacterized protein n=1 Tax=Fusarium heterosporum TaxID=42747 RepID=A0A8H5TY04_FUSHE|nr:hypothetical protein FHETE_1280 [Fusarium heterosporum]
MSTSEEVEEVLPTFVSCITKPSPLLYFHHVIDPDDTTLTVQVLGANISFKFSHLKTKNALSRSTVASQLENKTTGFIALVKPNSQRVVLAAAESGHGMGRHGDMLDKKKGVLPNSIWTKRVVAFGKTLGLNMKRFFDNPQRIAGNTEGIFLGSHVEVKLAVHGICVLLKMFSITEDFNNVTMQNLSQLRHVRWEDGSRPIFEVYFSRKQCHPCRSLVDKLQEATGVTIRLSWRHRLVMKTYPVRTIRFEQARPGEAQSEQVFDSQDYDFGDTLPDDSDVEVISDDEIDQSIDTIDLTNIRSTSPAGITAELDALFDGLAYRVGQMEECPEGATAAIVGFAKAMSTHNKKKNPLSAQDVNKPLPATPVIEAPVDVVESNERRQTFPRAQRSLFGRSRDKNPSRARSASPLTSRRDTVRERSPRRYNMGTSGKFSVEFIRERALATARPEPRSAHRMPRIQNARRPPV